MTPTEARAYLAELPPATDLLIARLVETVKEQREHEHQGELRGPDLYCLNLTSFMGERMGAVLRRLSDAQAEIERLRARLMALADEADGYLRRVAELEGEEW